MKINKIFFLTPALILTFLLGCEKKFDNVVDSSNPDYQVISVSPSDSVKYTQTDSLVTIRISLNSFTNVQSVYCDIYASDNSKLNSSSLLLLDNGNTVNGDTTANDGTFSNKFPLSTYNLNGIYSIKYFITDKSSISKQVASGTFPYNNGQPNMAPIISNDVVFPDSAVVTNPTIILTSVKAIDQNSPLDIEKVYFVVYRPDGTTNNNQIELFDDGNFTEYGDQLAGDGIYSRLIQITPGNVKGIYRIEFQARDRSGELSNIINHSLLIQ